MGGRWSRLSAPSKPAAQQADLRKLWQLLTRELTLPSHAEFAGATPGAGASDPDEPLLPWAVFQDLFSDEWNGPIVKRVFDVLDYTRRGAISADEFVVGLHPLTPAGRISDRLRFVFRCLDLDDSQSISREELLVWLRVCASSDAVREQMPFTPEQLEQARPNAPHDMARRGARARATREHSRAQVATATFADAQLDESGELRWEGFARLIQGRPRLAERMACRRAAWPRAREGPRPRPPQPAAFEALSGPCACAASA